MTAIADALGIAARIFPQCATDHRHDRVDGCHYQTPIWSPTSGCSLPTCLAPRPMHRPSSISCPLFDHYKEVHPHRALGYRSPREFIAQTREALSGL